MNDRARLLTCFAANYNAGSDPGQTWVWQFTPDHIDCDTWPCCNAGEVVSTCRVVRDCAIPRTLDGMFICLFRCRSNLTSN